MANGAAESINFPHAGCAEIGDENKNEGCFQTCTLGIRGFNRDQNYVVLVSTKAMLYK